MIILVDNGHGVNTAGKCSPDGKLREYKYCREIAAEVVNRLKAEGYAAHLVVEEDADIPLGERCNRVNAVCNQVGKKNVCLVSIHLNASGNGKEWMTARGWEAWTSVGQTGGDVLAECLYVSAKEILSPLIKDLKIRADMSDGDMDKEKDFTILKRTNCPACLTENLFQDTKADYEFLLSGEGRKAIVDLHVEGIKAYILSRG